MPEPITITDQGTPSLSEDNQAALEELKQKQNNSIYLENSILSLR